MIPRYTREKMEKIWLDDNKFANWLKVEIAVTEAWSEEGRVPADSVKRIKENAGFNAEKILEIEKVTKHDVIAFLENIAEYVGDDAKHIHLGLTSSDVLDTAFALQLKQASELLIEDVEKILEILKRRAYEFKDTLMIGRTHGIHAEPITFGLKLASWYSEMKRALERLKRAKEVISYGAISGAVGNFSTIPPHIEEKVMKKLGLKAEPVSTQVIPRDRHAEFFAELGVVASSIERFAVEIRHLQRTEVLEAEEYFSKGQKGSSAMPHKRNPILSENMVGLARIVRSAITPAMENVALWHERDISHSSVERMIAPDATVTLDYLLNRFAMVIDKLTVYPENMIKNINLTRGLLFSQRAMLALIDTGMQRKDSYEMVQKHAMDVWRNRDLDLKTQLMNDPDISKLLNEDDFNRIFDLGFYTSNIGYIFKRVFET